MLFGPAPTRIMLKDSVKIYIDDTLIVNSLCESAKQFVVIIYCDLWFREYVSQLIRRAHSKLRLLYPHRHLNTNTKMLAHFNCCDVLSMVLVSIVTIIRKQNGISQFKLLSSG